LIGDVRVTVLGIVRRKHGRIRVKLGIDAPPAIPILRAELTRFERDAQGMVARRSEFTSIPEASGQSADQHEEADA
jgi:sRNA-binding carbon storage regulator CsrA